MACAQVEDAVIIASNFTDRRVNGSLVTLPSVF